MVLRYERLPIVIFLEVLPTHRYVSVIAADFDLRTLGDCVATGIKPDDHRCFAAAKADRLQFIEVVCPGEQVLASFEWLALKVGTKPIGQHRYVELHR